MKRIQDLLDRGIITSFTVGKSAIIKKGLFCSMRFNSLDGYMQGGGETVEEAFADTLRRVPGAMPAAPAPAMPVIALKMPGMPT